MEEKYYGNNIRKKYIYMDDKIIIQTRLDWWVYPVILFDVLLVFVLCDAEVWEFLLVGGRSLGILFGFVLSAIPIGIFKIWSMRRVKVYSDRIEVRYLFHRKWNSQIMLKDVDCCCAEVVEVETKDDWQQHNRIYLLTGNKLWLYISGKDCANSEEMLSVLTEHFGIPLRNGSINLSAEEQRTVWHGGYILLEDISREELTAMGRQRRRHQEPRSDFDSFRSTRRKYFFIEYGLILLIAAFFVMYFLGRFALRTVKEKKTVALSYIDGKTEIPSEIYYIVDSVDVDAEGILCSSYKMRWNKNIDYWAFPVKGRNDLWISVAIEDRKDVPSSVYYGSDYCVEKLHRRYTYKIATNENEYQNVVSAIVKASNTKTKGEFMLLAVCDENPISTGRVFYFDALSWKQGAADSKKAEDKEHKRQKAFQLMKQAAEEVAAAQYSLGLMYEFGDCVAADSVEAFRWYELAAGQEYDANTRVEAMNQMSYIYARRRQYEKAIAVIDSAISIWPMEANLYDSKGEHLYKSGDVEGAWRMWKRVMELDPKFMETHDSELFRLIYGK